MNITQKQRRDTKQRELVETHNLLLALNRLGGSPYDKRWRRAFLHAFQMSQIRDNATTERLRIALEMP